ARPFITAPSVVNARAFFFGLPIFAGPVPFAALTAAAFFLRSCSLSDDNPFGSGSEFVCGGGCGRVFDDDDDDDAVPETARLCGACPGTYFAEVAPGGIFPTLGFADNLTRGTLVAEGNGTLEVTVVMSSGAVA